MSFIFLLLRFVVGGVFIYSGWEKLMTPAQNFAAVIDGYQLVPSTFVYPVAFLFPWLELIFGTFLVVGYLKRISAFVLGIFLVVFIGLLSRSLILKLPITECGCFGAGLVLAPEHALMLDMGLFIALFIILKWSSQRFTLDERLGQ